MTMQSLIYSEVKIKKAGPDNLNYQVKEKSNKTKFDLAHKFYQKLFLMLLASCVFLIFPESPKDSEVLCNKYHSNGACIIW